MCVSISYVQKESAQTERETVILVLYQVGVKLWLKAEKWQNKTDAKYKICRILLTFFSGKKKKENTTFHLIFCLLYPTYFVVLLKWSIVFLTSRIMQKNRG